MVIIFSNFKTNIGYHTIHEFMNHLWQFKQVLCRAFHRHEITHGSILLQSHFCLSVDMENPSATLLFSWRSELLKSSQKISYFAAWGGRETLLLHRVEQQHIHRFLIISWNWLWVMLVIEQCSRLKCGSQSLAELSGGDNKQENCSFFQTLLLNNIDLQDSGQEASCSVAGPTPRPATKNESRLSGSPVMQQPDQGGAGQQGGSGTAGAAAGPSGSADRRRSRRLEKRRVSSVSPKRPSSTPGGWKDSSNLPEPSRTTKKRRTGRAALGCSASETGSEPDETPHTTKIPSGKPDIWVLLHLLSSHSGAVTATVSLFFAF